MKIDIKRAETIQEEKEQLEDEESKAQTNPRAYLSRFAGKKKLLEEPADESSKASALSEQSSVTKQSTLPTIDAVTSDSQSVSDPPQTLKKLDLSPAQEPEATKPKETESQKANEQETSETKPAAQEQDSKVDNKPEEKPLPKLELEKATEEQPVAQKPRPQKKKLTKMATMSQLKITEQLEPEKKAADDATKREEPGKGLITPKNLHHIPTDWTTLMSPRSLKSSATTVMLSAEEKEAKEKEKKKRIITILSLIADYDRKKDDGLYSMNNLFYY